MFKYLKQFAFEEKDRYIFMAFQEENLAIVNIYIYTKWVYDKWIN